MKEPILLLKKRKRQSVLQKREMYNLSIFN